MSETLIEATERESVLLTHEQLKAQGFCSDKYPCNYCLGLMNTKIEVREGER